MLDEMGRCSVHSSRPMTCRAYISTSEAQCQKYCIDGQSLPDVLSVGGIVRAAYMDTVGLDDPPNNEINTLFKKLYNSPSMMDIWATDLDLPARPSIQIDLIS
jgi:Fe-S-cluster containining protein